MNKIYVKPEDIQPEDLLRIWGYLQHSIVTNCDHHLTFGKGDSRYFQV